MSLKPGHKFYVKQGWYNAKSIRKAENSAIHLLTCCGCLFTLSQSDKTSCHEGTSQRSKNRTQAPDAERSEKSGRGTGNL